MSLNKRKRKGFTLIELVIVLAVLAIIALIAIPNFNKVRTDSKKKADAATCDVIKRVTQMALADKDMVVTGDVDITITPVAAKNGVPAISPNSDVSGKLDWKDAVAGKVIAGEVNYANSLKEVRPPQVKDKTTFTVKITLVNGVEVIEVV